MKKLYSLVVWVSVWVAFGMFGESMFFDQIDKVWVMTYGGVVGIIVSSLDDRIRP